MRSTRQATAADHQRHARRAPQALLSTALRTKSVHAREILAELAWPGHTPADLEGWAESGAPWPVLEADQDPRWVARYAQVLAVQLNDAAERHAARRMLEAIWAGVGALAGRAQEVLFQLRLVERDTAALKELPTARRMRPEVMATVQADSVNPWLFPGADQQAWEEEFNSALHSQALDDLTVRSEPVPGWPGAEHPLDRLQATVAQPIEAPYLVTVLMSCFRPGPELETAVRAVLDQSWRNLELLLIDDGSGPEFASTLLTIAGRDPRIRLIRKAVNGGTYRARNTGLRIARGDFVTTLDSDDYLHPQAIELGARELLAQPGLLATRAMGVRVTPDLELTRPGYVPHMRAAGTLLFRRREVMDRIGWFDHTSKGADTEFATRMTAAFGSRIQDLPEVVLFLRDGDTLSSGEFSMGWRHGARFAYKASYRQWHADIARGETEPFLDPTRPRPFPEPRRWMKQPVPSDAARHRVEVCFAGDWRRYGGPQRSMLEEIAACREAGMSVAIMHLEAFRFMTPRDEPLCQPVMDLIMSGAVEWLQPDDDAHVDVLLLRYPPILQYPPSLTRPPLSVGRLLLVANQAPLELNGSDQRYVVQDVTARATELFGLAPVWIPQGAGVRKVLVEQDPDVALSSWDNPGLLDANQWLCRDERPPGSSGTVVVGRHSRDDRIKFPSTFAELRAGYDFPDGYQVRFMGGARTIPALARADAEARAAEATPPRTGAETPIPEVELPTNWELLPGKSMEVTDFLADLDFFLYLDNTEAHEAFGRVILEAAASGVLTIVHPKHRVVFGDAVDYALPGEAQRLIAHYVQNPEAYRDRVRRTRTAVAETYGHARFADRIRELLPAGREPDTDRPSRRTSVRLAVRPTGDRVRPITVEAEGDTEVLSLPLRSLSDGSRADQLVLVHTAAKAARASAVEWLRTQLTGPLVEGVGWLAATDAPPTVLAIVMVRERIVRWSMRDAPAVAGRSGDWFPDVRDAPHDGWWATSWRLRRESNGNLSEVRCAG